MEGHFCLKRTNSCPKIFDTYGGTLQGTTADKTMNWICHRTVTVIIHSQNFSTKSKTGAYQLNESNTKQNVY